jgi:hypothetical protein
MRRAAYLLVLGLALGVVSPRVVRAQAADPAVAAELFREGRAALDAKDFPLACAKLLESLRLDLRVGTLISLGECEQATGKLASARLRWQQAAQLARRTSDDRAPYCDQRFAAIDPRVPRLTIRIAASADRGTFVRKDSVDVGPAALGVPLPIEIGSHVVVALARHRDTRSYAVEGVEGQSSEIVVEPGDLLPELPAPDDVPPKDLPPTPPTPPARSTVLRTSAYVAGGLGVAGLGLGVYFGLKAIAGVGGSPGQCTGDVCDHAGAVARRDALASGNASTAAFVLGGALLSSGVVMFVVSLPGAPSGGVKVAPSASENGARVDVVGSW